MVFIGAEMPNLDEPAAVQNGNAAAPEAEATAAGGEAEAANPAILPDANVASSNSGAATAIEKSLRSEVDMLRQSLERHEKMLRYIMDRYVEKSATGGELPNFDKAGDVHAVTAAEAHDVASAVNYSAPEFVSKSYADGENGAADVIPMEVRGSPGVRKRKGGSGDTVGVPGLEGG